MSLKTLHDEMNLDNCISRKSEILVSVIASGCVSVSCYLERFPEEGWVVGCIADERLDELKSFVFARI